MKLTPVRPQRLEKLLFSLGFVPIRQKGSHVFYRHQDGRTTLIPYHGGEEIGPKLIRRILKEIKITREEYLMLIKN